MRAFKPVLLTAALLSALAFSSSRAGADSLDLNLFSDMPVYRSVMADPNIPKTELNLPSGLESEILNQPLSKISGYTSLGKEIPVLSVNVRTDTIPKIIPPDVALNAISMASSNGKRLSDKVFSASLVAGGSLSFPENEAPNYLAEAELFLGSPMIDDYLSEGNNLFLVGGVRSRGTINAGNLGDRTILSLPEIFSMDSYSFMADLYIVAKSPYSNQYVLLKAGVEGLGGNGKDKTNINFSGTIELPSLSSWIDILKDTKILPYVSFDVKLPLDYSQTIVSGEVGGKLVNNSGKALMIYGRINNSKGDYVFSSGLKLDL